MIDLSNVRKSFGSNHGLRDVSFEVRVADRVIFMDGGVIVEAGAAKQVLSAPGTERMRSFLDRVLKPL